MSGPIIRTGPTPLFSQNWDNVFGKRKGAQAATAKKATAKKASKKATKKKK